MDRTPLQLEVRPPAFEANDDPAAALYAGICSGGAVAILGLGLLTHTLPHLVLVAGLVITVGAHQYFMSRANFYALGREQPQLPVGGLEVRSVLYHESGRALVRAAVISRLGVFAWIGVSLLLGLW